MQLSSSPGYVAIKFDLSFLRVSPNICTWKIVKFTQYFSSLPKLLTFINLNEYMFTILIHIATTSLNVKKLCNYKMEDSRYRTNFLF